MNIDSKITSIFEKMHQTASFGVLKNTAEVIIGLVEQYPKAVIVNVVADDIDATFDDAIKQQLPCIRDRTLETCKILMGPKRVDKITERVLMILPNHIVSYAGVKKLVIEFQQFAPEQIISLAWGLKNYYFIFKVMCISTLNDSRYVIFRIVQAGK